MAASDNSYKEAVSQLLYTPLLQTSLLLQLKWLLVDLKRWHVIPPLFFFFQFWEPDMQELEYSKAPEYTGKFEKSLHMPRQKHSLRKD